VKKALVLIHVTGQFILTGFVSVGYEPLGSFFSAGPFSGHALMYIFIPKK